MVKNLAFRLNSVRHTLIADIIIVLAVTLSLFVFSEALASARYRAIGYERALSAFRNDAVFYVDASHLQHGGFSDRAEENNLERKNYVKAFGAMPGVKNLYLQESFSVSAPDDPEAIPYYVRCYSSPMLSLFPELSRGEWFDNPVNEDGSINVIVCGALYLDAPLGSTVTFVTNSAETVVLRICGNLYAPTAVPLYGSYSSQMLMRMLYKDDVCFVTGLCDRTEMLIETDFDFQSVDRAYEYCFLEFEASATDEEKTAVLHHMEQYGGCQTVADILQNSKEELRAQLLSDMMTPLFLLGISLIAYLSISVLTVQKKIYGYSVYYLLGFSKSRMVLEILGHLLFLLLPGSVLNVIYVVTYRGMAMRGLIELGKTDAELYFDSMSPYIVMIVAGAMFLLTAMFCIILLHKKSPADVWRRSKE